MSDQDRPLVVAVATDDADLARLVEGVVSSFGPVEVPVIRDPGQLAEVAYDVDVLVAGPEYASPSWFGSVVEFHERSPTTVVVLAFDRRPRLRTDELVEAGADALVDPWSGEEFRAALRRAVELAARTRERLVAAAPGPADVPLGRVFTTCSATGGCGKTFFATNAAWFFARFGGRTVVVDLDLQFGEVSSALRVRPTGTITDLLGVGEEEVGNLLGEVLVEARPRLWVLAAPKEPAVADRVTPADVGHILGVLESRFDYIVVDTPTGLGEVVLSAFDHSEHLFVLAAVDLASIRNLRLFVQTLDRLQIPADDISLVLNKEQRGVGITAAEVAELFPRGFAGVIPFSREVPAAMNRGVPILEAHPDAVVSRRLVEVLTPFLPEGARAEVERAFGERPGLLARVFGRRRTMSQASAAGQT